MQQLNWRLFIISILATLASVTTTLAQTYRAAEKRISLEVKVLDSLSRESLVGVLIVADADGKAHHTVTDQNGVAHIQIDEPAKVTIHASYLGYKEVSAESFITQNSRITLEMAISSLDIDAVIVTAQEVNKGATSSKISKESLSLLQPSSLTDIFELLPGGVSKDPSMGSANLATIREPDGVPSSGYSIATLGTGFVMDGVPISNNMNLQGVLGEWDSSILSKNTTGQGVDMRSISTDGIESVEVIRGVASVIYGDMTNGMVKINRNYSFQGFDARMKVDAKSKLFYVANSVKFGEKGGVLNMGVDYYTSRVDPRSNLENFDRVNFSSRYRKVSDLSQGRLSVSSYLDYSTTIDNYKQDYDLHNHAIESFKSQNQNIVGNVNISLYDIRSWITKLSLQSSATMGFSDLEKVDYIQLDRPTAVPNTEIEGVFDALILPSNYTSYQRVEGRPLSVFTQFIAELTNKNWDVDNSLLFGGDWRYEKNYGEGYIFDLSTPPSPSITTKPRPFNEVPAFSQLALYAEPKVSLPIGDFKLDVTAGLRAQSLLGVDSRYTIANKWYLDPRINVKLDLPELRIAGRALRPSLNFGYGLQTKMPTASHLYPNPFYYTYTQLNYFHENPDYRLINMKSFRVDPTNFELDAARNRKSELRLDLEYTGHHLSITYFDELLDDGFRSSTQYQIFDYLSYETEGVQIDGKPDISQLPYTNELRMGTYGVTTNGSTIDKQGVEFQLTLKRFDLLNLRLTINGAWMSNKYHNSQPFYEKASEIIGGETIEYIGVYNDNSGYTESSFNTSFYLDSYIPKIGLNVMLSAQCMWNTTRQQMWESGTPTHYIGVDGIVHEFDIKNIGDNHLYMLVNRTDPSLLTPTRNPTEVYFNIKVRKTIYKDSSISLFVNRAFAYLPEYELNGVTQIRYTVPYFGAELNLAF